MNLPPGRWLPRVILTSERISPTPASRGESIAPCPGLGDSGDGKPDIISGDTYGDIHLYLGDGSGTFANSGVKINQLYNDAYSLVAGDFNGDSNADFVLARATDANEGQLHLYLGNGNGTFQGSGLGPSPGFEQLGITIGVAGLDPMSLAAGDVDNNGDLDLVSGERVNTAVPGDTADIILWRNRQAQGSPLTFIAEVLIQGVERGFAPDPEQPPYFPPEVYLHGYGLTLGDVTGDGLPDLLVGDYAHYLYIYKNTGGASFSPIRYNNVSTGTRPYAYNRLDELLNEAMPLASADVNHDGDGITNGPLDPALRTKAKAAKARWSRNNTHFIIRIDALGRLFQNEFTQVLTDAAILTPGEWEEKKFESYNGSGDAPATTAYQIPADLPGGMNCPVTVAATYRLARSPDLLAFSDIIVSGFKPSATTDTLIDTSPPAGKAFYRVEKE